MKHDGERRPDEIEAEIERTRAEMEATLHAIEGRLTPGQLIDQGLGYLRHGPANEFVSRLGDSVRQHPLPVTLVGIGLAWLMAIDRSSSTHGGTGEHADEAEQTRHDTSGAVGERIGASTRNARDKVSHAASAARERTARMSESARHQVDRARGGYEHLAQEQPLALGAIGLAVGAVLAATLPRSRMEDKLSAGARPTGPEQPERHADQGYAAGHVAPGAAHSEGLGQTAGTQAGATTGETR